MDSTSMLLNNWLGIAATTGHLGLALLVVRRGQRSTLRLPLTLFCVNMTVWSFAAAAHDLFDGFGWHWLEVTASPLTIPLGLHIVLAFVGRRRRHALFLAFTYVYFIALAIAGGVGLLYYPQPEPLVQSQLWSAAYLAGLTPPFVYIVYRLTRHYRGAARSEEKTRTQLIFAGLMVGLALGSTELLDSFFPFVTGLGHAGTLAVSATLTIVTLRFRLLDYELATSNWLFGTTVALFCVAGYLLFFGTSRAAFLVFIAAALAFVAVVGLRELVVATARRRERIAQYATLGRFSAQMAHDVKNPLTAIKGAAQYLENEVTGTEHADVVELMEEQIRRLETIVERYQRMSSVTPKTVSFDLREMLMSQIRAAEITHPDVVFQIDVDARLTDCVGDAELLDQVFDNVLRNALEAMPDGGEVKITAAPTWNGIVVRIEDSGEGMEQRDIELAFDDFYTTKADGTGLGLAFARRVVEAHGGRIELNSVLDVGTAVAIHLPNP